MTATPDPRAGPLPADGAPGPEAPGMRWQNLRTALRSLGKTLRLVWSADRRGTVALTVVVVLTALLPTTQAWVGKLIVDAVVEAVSQRLPVRVGLERALPFLLLEFGLIALGSVLMELRTLLKHVLGARLRFSTSTAIMRKALDLDLPYFEDPRFYDKLQNARRETDFRTLTILDNSFTAVQQCITLASLAAVVLVFSPLIGLILFGATIPLFVAQTRYSDVYFRIQTWRVPEFRRMHYLEQLLTTDATAKEVKLFGLGEPLLKRYHDIFWKFYREDTALARRRGTISIVWGLLAASSYYVAYTWIVWRTVGGRLSLGEMTLLLAVFRQAQGAVQALFGGVIQLYESGRFMDNLFGFLELQPRMLRPAHPRPVPRPLRQGIEFRDVSFRYHEGGRWVLRHVNLHVAPGEKLALVGANGAGKTTFVKLLTRLYDPTEGQVLLDGIDIREYDVEQLRACIGVIFQDFVRYHATARENIGFGQIEALDDQERIAGAARRGGADEVISHLPAGYDTVLGNWFEGGNELSGGQWQKVALGRAFMRDSEVLVLDEPTAALDAEQEYEIFQRFRELTEGRIALLISHRFSTVRIADRIAVLEGGTVTEYGTHPELLDLEGTYAQLFNLQAEGYR
ncbi:MAG TPA: ABC transporter ATP-binding protein [Longimicrobiaceae bacterium]